MLRMLFSAACCCEKSESADKPIQRCQICVSGAHQFFRVRILGVRSFGPAILAKRLRAKRGRTRTGGDLVTC